MRLLVTQALILLKGQSRSNLKKLQSEHDNLDSKEMMTTNPEQEMDIVRGKETLRQHFLTRPKWIFLVFIIFLCVFSLMTAINPQMRSYSMVQAFLWIQKIKHLVIQKEVWDLQVEVAYKNSFAHSMTRPKVVEEDNVDDHLTS